MVIVVTNIEYHCQEQETQLTLLQWISHILLRLPVQVTKCVYLKLHNGHRKAVKQTCLENYYVAERTTPTKGVCERDGRGEIKISLRDLILSTKDVDKIVT